MTVHFSPSTQDALNENTHSSDKQFSPTINSSNVITLKFIPTPPAPKAPLCPLCKKITEQLRSAKERQKALKKERKRLRALLHTFDPVAVSG